jgi:mannose-6-phosphate isomerase-like protein (cupin superfamily)
MSDYTRVNFKDDVEDMAVKFDLSPQMESRFGRRPLGLEQQGISYFRLAPDVKTPFGHRHGEQEEVYVVISGSARMKLEDEIVELRRWDAIRVPGHTTRAFQAGPDGVELIVTGAPFTDNKDAEMLPGWWED